MLTTKNRSLIRTRFTFQQNLNLKECIDGPLPHLCPAMYVHVRTCVSEPQERCICLQVSRSSPGPHRRPSTCRVTLPPRSPSVTQPAQPSATPAPSTSRRYSLRCCWRRHDASVYKDRRYTTSLGEKRYMVTKCDQGKNEVCIRYAIYIVSNEWVPSYKSISIGILHVNLQANQSDVR